LTPNLSKPIRGNLDEIVELPLPRSYLVEQFEENEDFDCACGWKCDMLIVKKRCFVVQGFQRDAESS
jgi:hypothetical protein